MEGRKQVKALGDDVRTHEKKIKVIFGKAGLRPREGECLPVRSMSVTARPSVACPTLVLPPGRTRETCRFLGGMYVCTLRVSLSRILLALLRAEQGRYSQAHSFHVPFRAERPKKTGGGAGEIRVRVS